MGRAASIEDLKELEELLARYPESIFLMEALESIKGGDNFNPGKRIDGQALITDEWEQGRWEELAARLERDRLAAIRGTDSRFDKQGSTISILRMLAAAALVFGLLLFAKMYFFPRNPEQALAKVHTVTTPYGKKNKSILPDSTVVWLNSGSRLTYSDFTGRGNREVYLEGEAFFDVEKDMTHPFIVHAGSISIKVIGTAFNVKAYGGEKNIETTLIRGSIEVRMNDSEEKKILLSPNEKLTVINGEVADRSASGPIRQNELKYQVQELALGGDSGVPVPETAWTENKLVFVDESFRGIAEKMERWYDVKIYFEDEELSEERMSGIFQQEDIRQALKILQMTTAFRFRIIPDTESADRDGNAGATVKIFK